MLDAWSLWRGIALQALSVIVFWERGGEGWRSLDPSASPSAALGASAAGSRGRPSPHEHRIAGWAFDAMTGKRGGDEFDQTIHRGS
jgi:hypothetical protein